MSNYSKILKETKKTVIEIPTGRFVALWALIVLGLLMWGLDDLVALVQLFV